MALPKYKQDQVAKMIEATEAQKRALSPHKALRGNAKKFADIVAKHDLDDCCCTIVNKAAREVFGFELNASPRSSYDIPYVFGAVIVPTDLDAFTDWNDTESAAAIVYKPIALYYVVPTAVSASGAVIDLPEEFFNKDTREVPFRLATREEIEEMVSEMPKTLLDEHFSKTKWT